MDETTEFCEHPVVYTFGAPRIGLRSFVERITKELDANNIHRVYHNNDAVPMIAPYPYRHAPSFSHGHMLQRQSTSISLTAHFMANYIDSVDDHSWETLNAQPIYTTESAKLWLAEDKPRGNISSISVRIQQLLACAIEYVMDLIQKGTGAGDTLKGATLLDHLSYLTIKGFKATWIQLASARHRMRKEG